MRRIVLLFSLLAISADALSFVTLQNNAPNMATDINKDNVYSAISTSAVDILSASEKKHHSFLSPNNISTVKKEKVYLKLNQVGAWFWSTPNSQFKVGGMITTHQWWEYDDARLRDINTSGNLPMTGINATYQNGRFSAETGVLNHESNGAKFFIQGAYVVARTTHFSLKLTAKIEALDDKLVQHYYGVNNADINELSGNENAVNTQHPASTFRGESSENTSLGLTGSYYLNDHWTVTGSVITTTLGDEISASPLINNVSRNMALIGTTYSF